MVQGNEDLYLALFSNCIKLETSVCGSSISLSPGNEKCLQIKNESISLQNVIIKK